VTKVVQSDFGSRSKVLIMVNFAFKSFDLVPKSVPTTLNTGSKVFIMQNFAFKTFDLVIKLQALILALDQKF
jgi:hypothetical protein